MTKNNFPFSGKLVDSENRVYFWDSGKLFQIQDVQVFDNSLRISPGKAAIFVAVSILLFSVFFYISRRLSLSSGLTVLVTMVPTVIPIVIAYFKLDSIRRSQLVRVNDDAVPLGGLKYENPKKATWFLLNGLLCLVIAPFVLLSKHTVFETVLWTAFAISSVYNIVLYFQYSKRTKVAQNNSVNASVL